MPSGPCGICFDFRSHMEFKNNNPYHRWHYSVLKIPIIMLDCGIFRAIWLRCDGPPTLSASVFLFSPIFCWQDPSGWSWEGGRAWYSAPGRGEWLPGELKAVALAVLYLFLSLWQPGGCLCLFVAVLILFHTLQVNPHHIICTSICSIYNCLYGLMHLFTFFLGYFIGH